MPETNADQNLTLRLSMAGEFEIDGKTLRGVILTGTDDAIRHAARMLGENVTISTRARRRQPLGE